MGIQYDCGTPSPAYQHRRLAALRQLTGKGIPCILWGEDTLCFAHNVPTVLFDQQILVPDDCVESAAAVLQEDAYIPADAPAGSTFLQAHGPLEGKSPWPRVAIRLRHRDIPADDIFKLEPVPAFIILIPQSHYGLDVRAKERFQSLVPPLDASNAGILVPKFHTFLEGLVHYALHPPFGLDVPQNQGLMWNDVYLSYLIQYRVQYDPGSDDVLPRKALLPNEQAVLRQLQTDDARWYMNTHFRRGGVNFHERREYTKSRNVVQPDKPSLPTVCVPGLLKSLSLDSSLNTAPRHSWQHPPTTSPPLPASAIRTPVRAPSHTVRALIGRVFKSLAKRF